MGTNSRTFWYAMLYGIKLKTDYQEHVFEQLVNMQCISRLACRCCCDAAVSKDSQKIDIPQSLRSLRGKICMNCLEYAPSILRIFPEWQCHAADIQDGNSYTVGSFLVSIDVILQTSTANSSMKIFCGYLLRT